MLRRPAESLPQTEALADEEVVARVLAGETSLFEIIMRRYNQRLFRTLRAMVPSDSDAEDILQEAYVRAYRHLAQFQGRAKFSTWLTRIAIHELFARRRTSRRFASLDDLEQTMSIDRLTDHQPSPDEKASSKELGVVIERALQRMPESLRVVFMMREVEGLDTDETADCLGISSGNVKVRLHRARELLRTDVDSQLGVEVRQLHQFAGHRCDAIVAGVLKRIVT